ncbi:DUF4352 domain-containing protein [Cohnella mopanensis]|uniref:DUF4352 domain-containing protein n=1 Tax=Cohnella mopanensis TaxID=2911966 RepID=UPI001EF7EB73|nr:DUF4352 domain-containing protein [Cohnella mopanensis]
MKKKLALSLMILVVVFASLALGAYAAAKYSLSINGKQAKGEVKIIDGSIYVPLAALSSLENITVKRDAKKGTIAITDKVDESPLPPVEPDKVGLAPNNPTPVGKAVSFNLEGYFDKFVAVYKVEETVRGDKAWQLLKDVNPNSAALDKDYEYLLAKIKVTTSTVATADGSTRISTGQFKLVSTTGKDYDSTSIVTPKPELFGILYEGQSTTGWVAFKVKKDDANPLILFGRKTDGTGGLWLKTN